MNRGGLLSVVVPAHADTPNFRRLLESLLNSKESILREVIVCDTCVSGLKLGDLESKFEGRLKRIELPGGEPGPARNLGIELATGPWILFVDSDDFIDVNALDALLDIGEPSPGSPFVSFGFSWTLLSGQRRFGPCSTLEEMILANPSSFWRHLYSVHALRVAGVTFPDGLIAEDLVYLSRLSSFGVNPISVNQVLYMHAESLDSTSHVRDARWLQLPKQLVEAHRALSLAGRRDLWRVLWRRNAVSGLLSTPASLRLQYMVEIGIAIRSLQSFQARALSIIDLAVAAVQYLEYRLSRTRL